MKSECYAEKTYRYTLTVQSPSGTPDEYGQIDLTDPDNWADQGTIKANFVSKGGREFYRAAQIQADISELIETPWNNFAASIQPEWKLLHGSRVLQITTVFDKDQRRNVIHIYTKQDK